MEIPEYFNFCSCSAFILHTVINYCYICAIYVDNWPVVLKRRLLPLKSDKLLNYWFDNQNSIQLTLGFYKWNVSGKPGQYYGCWCLMLAPWTLLSGACREQCRINGSLSFTRENFNHFSYLSVVKSKLMLTYSNFSYNNSVKQGRRIPWTLNCEHRPCPMGLDGRGIGQRLLVPPWGALLKPCVLFY